MILPGIHDSLPISMSKDQPEYMYSVRIVHSVLLPSAKPFKGQRSGTPTMVLHSYGHSIPFHSTVPFHHSSPPNPYTPLEGQIPHPHAVVKYNKHYLSLKTSEVDKLCHWVYDYIMRAALSPEDKEKMVQCAVCQEWFTLH